MGHASTPEAGQDAGDLPDAAGVVDAFATLRDWVGRFALPDPESPEALRPIENARGVCVILRRSGVVLGSGWDASGDALMLRRAATRAMGQALGAVSAGPSDTQADPAAAALREEIRRSLGAALTIELEVAGQPRPLLGRTFQQAAARLERGLDGLAMRSGQRWAMRFPCLMRADNTAGEPAKLMPGLAIELGLPPEDLATLTAGDDVALYAFSTVHLAQLAPGGSARQTFRGDQIVAQEKLTPQRVAAMADGIAGHLLASLWPEPVLAEVVREPLGVMGTYCPSIDEHRPLVAPARDQALVSLALSRYADAPGVDAERAARAEDAAILILRDLAAVTDLERDPRSDAVVSAAAVLALLARPERRDDTTLAPFFEDVVRVVLAACEPGDPAGGVDPNAGPPRQPGPAGQAIMAAALCRLLRDEPGRVDAAAAQELLVRAWATVAPEQWMTLLPWIGWAEIDYAASTGGTTLHAERLRSIRRDLGLIQILGERAAAVPDLAGAFALAGAGGSEATAQTTRPASLMALMLREPALTAPEEVQAALASHLASVRFLWQLSVRPTLGWSLRNPRRALGGVRAAPWDSDLPTPAQALGLLTAVETLRSLEALDEPVQEP